MFRRSAALVAAVALLLIAAQPARSQYRGGGIYVQPYPSYGFYPYYGYNGFYSNGFSMYGPPVPTGAPIPGVFGGSDQRFNTGIFGGPYYPPPRPRAPAHMQPLPADLDRQVTELPNGPAALNDRRSAATLEIQVPVSTAEILIDGEPTTQTGTLRTFQTPPLEKGKRFLYDVEARWMENGQPKSRMETVTIEAGQRVQVDFRSQNQTPAPPK